MVSWTYAGLKSLMAEVKASHRLQPHILIVTPQETGIIELPETSVSSANDIRKLTEEVLTRLVLQHEANALVLVTTGRYQGKECLLIAVDDSEAAGLFSVPVRQDGLALHLGQPEPIPDTELYLKRIVMAPFVLAKRLN